MMTQFEGTHDLPIPDVDALTISQQLIDRISQHITQQQGIIPFDDYMAMVLYEPGLGYYSGGSRKFGESGDFITAPEVSSLFSRCLAQQSAEILSHFDDGIIFELGAGSGVMAKDLLLELQYMDCLPQAYWILEVSADLRQRQQLLLKETVPFYYDRIRWLDALPSQAINGVVLANEVLDALPVKRFQKTERDIIELGVRLTENGLDWGRLSATDQFNDMHTVLANDANFDVCMGLSSWLCSLNDCLHQGVMLFIDYGESNKDYYSIHRQDGTLLCHYRHRLHHDPFFFPGLQDITTSVNFTDVAEAADACGLRVTGYTTQAFFLLGCGLESLGQRQDTSISAAISQQVRRLTLPEEMGERFKVIALGRDYPHLLRGFALMDQRGRL